MRMPAHTGPTAAFRRFNFCTLVSHPGGGYLSVESNPDPGHQNDENPIRSGPGSTAIFCTFSRHSESAIGYGFQLSSQFQIRLNIQLVRVQPEKC
jgi:hypothetical protein